jgi:hypothetical protein
MQNILKREMQICYISQPINSYPQVIELHVNKHWFAAESMGTRGDRRTVECPRFAKD